jgi:hypothetical protein
MSMKNTSAYGQNWHLYEELGDNRGLYLRIDNVTVLLNKDILKGMLPVLQKLEKFNWQLITDQEKDQDFDSIIDILNSIKYGKINEQLDLDVEKMMKSQQSAKKCTCCSCYHKVGPPGCNGEDCKSCGRGC